MSFRLGHLVMTVDKRLLHPMLERMMSAVSRNNNVVLPTTHQLRMMVSLPPLMMSFSSSAAAAKATKASSRELIVVRHGETGWNRELRVQGVTDVPLNCKGRLQAGCSANAIAALLLLPSCPSSRTKMPRQVPKVIYSSQMGRATETADAIARSLSSHAGAAAAADSSHEEDGDGDVSSGRETTTTTSVSTFAALNEWNLGVLEGLKREEASEWFPDDWKVFAEWANPHVSVEHANRRVAGGESMEDVRRRVVTCLESIVLQEGHGDNGGGDDDDDDAAAVVVVTHGGVLGQLLRHVAVAQYWDAAAVGDNVVVPGRRDGPAANVRSSSSSRCYVYARPANACITRLSVDPATREWSILSWADTSHLEGDASPMDTNYAGGSSLGQGGRTCGATNDDRERRTAPPPRL